MATRMSTSLLLLAVLALPFIAQAGRPEVVHRSLALSTADIPDLPDLSCPPPNQVPTRLASDCPYIAPDGAIWFCFNFIVDKRNTLCNSLTATAKETLCCNTGFDTITLSVDSSTTCCGTVTKAALYDGKVKPSVGKAVRTLAASDIDASIPGKLTLKNLGVTQSEVASHTNGLKVCINSLPTQCWPWKYFKASNKATGQLGVHYSAVQMTTYLNKPYKCEYRDDILWY